MGYQSDERDIPLYGLNQSLPSHSGPSGRVQKTINGRVRKFVPAANTVGVNTPAQIQIDPRDGIVSVGTGSRSIADGTSLTPSWTNPQVLGPLEDQEVAIVNGVPKIWNGTSWSVFTGNTVVAHDLQQDVFHTSQHTIQAPTEAKIGGVTCSTWTETTVGSTGALTTSYVGFKASDGAWIVAPRVLYASSSVSVITSAKVVTDGAQFWVFYTNGSQQVAITLYDTNGAMLATDGIALATSLPLQGTWDVTAAPSTGGYTILYAAVASAVVGPGDVGVFFDALKWNGVAIGKNPHTDTSLHCSLYLRFLRNDTGNGLSYIATVRAVIDSDVDIWAYEVTNQVQTHEYNSGETVNLQITNVDTITGFAPPGSPVNVQLSIGLTPNLNTPASTGPILDPARRFLIQRSITRGGTAATVRTNQSVCQVTDAFPIDGNYYTVGYYQSGSGLDLTPRTQTVPLTIGDDMIGALSQPLIAGQGDYTQGSPLSLTNNPLFTNTVFVTGSHTIVAPAGGDSVVPFTASGMGSVGVPDGTILLKWKIAGLGSTATFTGGRLVVTSTSGVTQANGTWDIVNVPATNDAVYTKSLNITAGNNIAPNGFFAAAIGTVAVQGMTAYIVQDASGIITSDQIASFYINGGSVTVTGSTHGNNISGVGVARVYRGVGPAYMGLGSAPWNAVWVATGSQSTAVDAFALTLTPALPNSWTFAAGKFSSADVGADLNVSNNPAVPGNVGTFPITSVTSQTTIVTASPPTQILPQVFSFPPQFPNFAIDLTTQQPYTFKLQGLTLDYTYQNAIVSVQDAQNAANDGTYQITTITGAHTFIATRTDGSTNQVNETFIVTGPSAVVITVFFLSNIQPLFQPTWLLIPLTGTQPVAGRWEYGQAYADWRHESNTTANLFQMSLSAVTIDSAGAHFVLPYRAQNVTQAVPLVTVIGQVPFAEEIIGNTVGLKEFTIANTVGLGFQDSDSFSAPGPLATVISQSGCFESGINFAPEAPFLISQSTAGGATLGITVGATRIYQVVAEYTNENGDLIESIPSPPLTVQLTGTNNQATIGGRLLFPLGTGGAPVANTYGVTTRNVTISLYATAIQGGISTTQKYLLTNDLNPNQLAPVSTANPSGFSFPDTFTWNYLDSNPDVGLTDNEELYSDDQASRYPAPAFSRGIGNYKNRDWALGYDGALWVSYEKLSGQALAWNPALRWQFPANDKPKAIAKLDDYLFVFCQRTIYLIALGGVTLPAPNGVGTLPTPVPLPWPVGSANGFALGIPDLVVFDSTAGGLWAINRGLETLWLGHPAIDTLTGNITGLCLDAAQKLYVQQDGSNSSQVVVYDHVPGVWGVVACPTAPSLIATYRGQFAYEDASGVHATVVGAVNDQIAGTTYGIAPDHTLQLISMANVRGLKMIWGGQAVGTYLGPHRVNFVISYPDDGYPDQVIPPFTPDGTKPYVIQFYLENEECTSFQLRMYADFTGVGTPGLSFSLELLSLEFGVQPGRLAQLPNSQAAT